jgi:hypothetical protein
MNDEDGWDLELKFEHEVGSGGAFLLFEPMFHRGFYIKKLENTKGKNKEKLRNRYQRCNKITPKILKATCDDVCRGLTCTLHKCASV